MTLGLSKVTEVVQLRHHQVNYQTRTPCPLPIGSWVTVVPVEYYAGQNCSDSCSHCVDKKEYRPPNICKSFDLETDEAPCNLADPSPFDPLSTLGSTEYVQARRSPSFCDYRSQLEAAQTLSLLATSQSPKDRDGQDGNADNNNAPETEDLGNPRNVPPQRKRKRLENATCLVPKYKKQRTNKAVRFRGAAVQAQHLREKPAQPSHAWKDNFCDLTTSDEEPLLSSHATTAASPAREVSDDDVQIVSVRQIPKKQNGQAKLSQRLPNPRPATSLPQREEIKPMIWQRLPFFRSGALDAHFVVNPFLSDGQSQLLRRSGSHCTLDDLVDSDGSKQTVALSAEKLARVDVCSFASLLVSKNVLDCVCPHRNNENLELLDIIAARLVRSEGDAYAWFHKSVRLAVERTGGHVLWEKESTRDWRGNVWMHLFNRDAAAIFALMFPEAVRFVDFGAIVGGSAERSETGHRWERFTRWLFLCGAELTYEQLVKAGWIDFDPSHSKDAIEIRRWHSAWRDFPTVANTIIDVGMGDIPINKIQWNSGNQRRKIDDINDYRPLRVTGESSISRHIDLVKQVRRDPRTAARTLLKLPNEELRVYHFD